jgi:hypothetical protein
MDADAETVSLSSTGRDRERTPSARISAILFDLDNTLIETRKADSLTAQKVKLFSLFLLRISDTISL